MLVKILLSTVFIATTAFAGKAQQLKGEVRDAQSGEALTGANVFTVPGNGTVTDERGGFLLELEPGEHRIVCSFVGYQNDTLEVHITESDNFVSIRLQPLVSRLGEVVISAGKFEQRLEQVSVSLDVIKPSLVQDKNLVSLKSTLQQSPGVNITDGQANIRAGSGWTYGAGTRVQTLVDGMPLISGDANQVLWDLVPIHSAERVEVLKGASSVLYGSAALNGVINVLTHSHPDQTALNVNLYSGIYDSPERKSLKWWDEFRFNSGFNFDYQQPFNPENALLLSGGHIQDEGFRYLDDEKRSRLFAKWSHQSSSVKGLEASLATHIMYSDLGNALLWESDSLGYIPLDSGITHAYGWDYYIDPVLRYRHGRFKHILQGRYLEVNNHSFDNQNDYTNTSELYFGEYQLQYFLEDFNATFGANSAYTLSQSVLFSGEHSSTNNALFLQLDYQPWEWLKLDGGIRYEAFRLDNRSYEKPVFRAGANVQVAEGSFVRASYGEAFRFPSVAESFTSTRVGVVSVYPNPNLEPETGKTYEAGFRQMFYSEQLRGYADLAVFQMHYSNMMEYNASFWGNLNQPLFGFGFKPLNTGESRIRGVEFSTSVEGDFGKKWDYRVLAGYTYTLPQIMEPLDTFAVDSIGIGRTYRSSSTDPSNNILKYRYQHLLKMDAQVNYQRWGFGFSLRYNSFMQNIDSIFVNPLLTHFVPGIEENRARNASGDLIVDCRINYRITEHWKASFIIDNLLNREVMTRPAYLGPPRLFTLRLNYSFGGANPQ